LSELGFRFNRTSTGQYVLDGRIEFVGKMPHFQDFTSYILQDDIETLVETSFLLRENSIRRIYRSLQWRSDEDTPETDIDEGYAPSSVSKRSTHQTEYRSGSESGAGDDESACSPTDTYHSQIPNCVHEKDHDRYLQPYLEQTTPLAARSPSVASWSSKTTNPFRNSAVKTSMVVDNEDSQRNVPADVWNEPLLI
jgi:hypothetical protein